MVNLGYPVKLATHVMRLWQSYIKQIKINYEKQLLVDSLLMNEIFWGGDLNKGQNKTTQVNLG